MVSKLIDLSHGIYSGLITYQGLPGPLICDYLSREQSRAFYDDDTEFQIGKIEMVTNTGTYVDVPFHRFADGEDLSQVGLERLANLPGVLIDASRSALLAIDRSWFEGIEVGGKAVLVHTGWADHWGTDQYFTDHPFLTEDAACFLRDVGVALVGIDSHNIDDTRNRSRPVHTTLLGAGIPIVEHLCHLERIPDAPFRFFAAPPKFEGVGTFPVRAFALIASSQDPSLKPDQFV